MKLGRGAIICLLIWLALVSFSAFHLIRGYQTVEPDGYGSAFLDIYLEAAVSAYLAFLVPMFGVFFTQNWRGVILCCAQIGATFLAARAATVFAKEIEFERTPPCWGVHSTDPGSGGGCPEGMRPDFTLDELRQWYAKQLELYR